MHRRGLQHISSTVSGSHVLTRCVHADAAVSPKLKKPTSRASSGRNGKPTLPPLPKDKKFIGPIEGSHRLKPKFRNVPKDVQKDVRDVINAFAHNSHNTTALERSVQSIVPSQTKTQFFAEPGPELEADYSVAEDLTVGQDVLPGTLIELRRNLTVTHGIVLSSSAEGLLRLMWTITSSGEIFKHLASDVVFAIPNAVDRDIVAACGDFSVQYDESYVLNPNQIAARVKVLKVIRSLEQDVETRYQHIAMRIRQALESASWFQSDGWEEVSAREVAVLVGARSQVDRLCVHKYLMAHHERFIAQSTDFLTAQKFWVRPRTLLEDLQLAAALIAQRSPVLDAFVEKARNIITTSQERRASSSASKPEVHPGVETSFSLEEQAIIRALIASVRSTRSTQKDPYVIPVATIMKRIGLHDVPITTSVVHQFLVDLGAIAPWDDPVSRERDLLLLSDRGGPLPSSPPSAPLLSQLGADEFYPHDIVEHVRHDFKDLPAFVIDDAGAEELDDAISIERIPSEPNRYWLHTHIADPTIKIHPSHTLAQLARVKFSTAYDVHQTIPMISSPVIYEELSLGSRTKQGLPENVLTFSAKVDESGNIIDYQVRAGVLRNVNVVKYDDVDKMIGLPPVIRSRPFEPSSIVDDTSLPSLPPHYIEDLRLLHDLTQRLVKNCYAKIGLWWATPAASVSLKPKPLPPNPSDLSHPSVYVGYPDLTYEVSDPDRLNRGARLVVAESAKVACRVASRFFLDRNIPFVRRASSQPRVPEEHGGLEGLLAMRREDGCLELDTVLKLSVTVPRGEYTLKPKGHYVIGVPDGEGYVRVTSPLRRYGDLVAHWQIKHALAATSGPSKPLYDSQWLLAFAQEMTAKEAARKIIERKHNQFWSYTYLKRWQADAQSHPDRPNLLDSMEAVVTRQPDDNAMFHRRQAVVTIPVLGVTARLDAKDRHLKVGDRVAVKFAEIQLGVRPEFGVALV